MAGGHLEVERKYEVAPDWQMPDLAALPDVTADDEALLELDAVYFDTVELRLLRSRATLRRRRGGHDEGWHLKLPSGADRLEVQRPLDPDAPVDEVPADLAVLARARARGEPLVPVARLRSRRLSHLLRDGEPDVVLAEVTEDEVTAEVLRPESTDHPVSRWREVEAELVDGDESLLERVHELLLASGAEVSGERSKVGRALEAWRAELDGRSAVPEGGGVAADPVLAYLRAQVDRLVAADSAVRLREPEGVHDMRVATRRLRSVLRSFRKLFEPGGTEPLREELAWLADQLGRARDAEVLREELLSLVGREPPELVLGPVSQRLDDELSATRQAALRAVVEALDGERYLVLLKRLDAFLAQAPVSSRGERKPQRALRKAVRREWRRVARRRDAVAAAPDGPPRDHALHEMRKAAKRGRYTAELVAAGLDGTDTGSDAADLAACFERLQDVLGEYQDSVVARSQLRRYGVEAHLAGENAFSFGRLHALEERRGHQALQQLEEAEESAEKAAERL
ncbi:MAG: CHAD domain-containing protein [Actinomycetes bacterium]